MADVLEGESQPLSRPEGELESKPHDRCLGRWFMNVDEWKPNKEEWNFAMRQIPPEERGKVSSFIFETDRKLALGSRLLQRFCVRSVLGLNDGEYEICRTEANKPYLRLDPGSKAEESLNRLGIRNFTFNVSHHGSVVALACEPDCVVGLDVVKETEFPRHQTTNSFFDCFETNFTKDEWRTIRSGKTEEEQVREFYRHWSMKEAYVKAHGMGLGIDLLTLSFKYASQSRDDPCLKRAKLCVEGSEPSPSWSFALMRVDSHHVATVCRAPPQMCHQSVVSCLPQCFLSVSEMERINEKPQPPFVRLGISDLIVPEHLSELNKVRHPQHITQQLPRAEHNEHIVDFRLRWLTWLYLSFNCTVLRCKPSHSVYALSSLQVDKKAHLLSVKGLPSHPDVSLILLGNVATNVDKIEEALLSLKEKFANVIFTLGSSELRLTEREQKEGRTSAGKLMSILELCDRIGVHTRPCIFSIGNKEPDLTVVPLFSWDSTGQSKEPFTGDASVEEIGSKISSQNLSDIDIVWPFSSTSMDKNPSSPAASISRFFAELNVEVQHQYNSPKVDIAPEIENGAGGRLRSSPDGKLDARQTVSTLSFSHFVGSQVQKDQLRKLAPDVHVFSHSRDHDGSLLDGQIDFFQCPPYDSTDPSSSSGSMDRLKRVWPKD